MFNVAILGYGGRGRIYAENFKYLGIEIAAVCDMSQDRLNLAQETLGCNKLFLNESDFFAAGKLADVLVIATLDDGHFVPSIRAMELGYDIILEKPIAMKLEECEKIAEKAELTGRSVTVCHVLRYAPFFTAIKRLLESGKFGDIKHLTMSEHVGYYHFAHSFVRGPWRNVKVAAPVILAKSCHDMDIISWFMGKKCTSVSSFGGLDFFNKQNRPEGSASFCYKCKYQESCEYNCFKIYLNKDYEKRAALARHGRLGGTDEEIIKSLSDESTPYARCVFDCDNDVFDHQGVNLTFENGAVGQFTLTAFTQGMSRLVHLYCENGEIYGDTEEKKVHYTFFGDPEVKTQEISFENELYASHGGGDMGLVKSFVDEYRKKDMASDIKWSLESHRMGFAADKSAQNKGEVVILK